MMANIELIANVNRVRARIAEAAARSSRAAESITLVGVSKYVDLFWTRALFEIGCCDLGESRPQSLWEKAANLNVEFPVDAQPRWHLIGPLQRNKVLKTLPWTSLIHSVDSAKLLVDLNSQAAKLSLVKDVLLEVNVSREPAKHGFTPEELPAIVAGLTAVPALRVCGLMTMSALDGGPEMARANFRELRELRDRLREQCPAPHELRELSMGMSDDFEIAIEEGATLVRVGSALWEGVPTSTSRT